MKTVCIYHSIDLDGWMSAAIVKHWFNSTQKLPSVETIDENCIETLIDSIKFIGYNYGQPIPDLSEYDKVIMCDISFPTSDMIQLTFEKNFIWIDHHISAIKALDNDGKRISGLRDTNYAACELTWKYFFPNETMPEIVRLLGRYDCFGHKGTSEEQKVLEFQYGARQVITNYEEAYIWLQDYFNYDSVVNKIHYAGKQIYQYLCTEAKQIYKNGFEIELIESYDKIGAKRKFICINKERFNPINFGIDYHKDGYEGAMCFHYDGVAKLWRFSLYNDNGLVDCSVIAKQFGGGGHAGAAGFVVKDINSVINNTI